MKRQAFVSRQTISDYNTIFVLDINENDTASIEILGVTKLVRNRSWIRSYDSLYSPWKQCDCFKTITISGVLRNGVKGQVSTLYKKKSYGEFSSTYFVYIISVICYGLVSTLPITEMFYILYVYIYVAHGHPFVNFNWFVLSKN